MKVLVLLEEQASAGDIPGVWIDLLEFNLMVGDDMAG